MHQKENNRFNTNIPSLQGLRILVVDNNIDSCDLMTMLLQFYGVEVQTAFSVQQALEIFLQWQPDVLVSEICLPKEDGFALIHQVRKLTRERGEEVIAIAVTGYVTVEMHQRALSAGFDLWFAKPLDFDEFLAVLNCLAICRKSSYTIAQGILGNASRREALSLEEQLELTFSG
ncbi:response regulator [Lyngbya aestuarii]|uniref:response regulator n=1 Tax=Lyngbya aestuarii TaxID=118322 RepID=UPI00403DA964